MFTEEEYQALKRAVLLRDTRVVQLDGQRVEFSSFAEMERRLQAIERELIKKQKRPKQFGIYSSKGV
ncbi:phage head-tail joining protein [Endozoicomonas sp. SESOKO1]|uniref:phage head-tail joining protein n=1 Tax=Endozoicomonas sp. SESOKO1 TaxID=2828742 RepID=UPI0035A0CB29